MFFKAILVQKIIVIEFSDHWWKHQIIKNKIRDICDVLRDLVPFVQFKKHEKHLCRSVTFSKVAG